MSGRVLKFSNTCGKKVDTDSNVCAFDFNSLFFGINHQIEKGIFSGNATGADRGQNSNDAKSPLVGTTDGNTVVSTVIPEKLTAYVLCPIVHGYDSLEICVSGILPIKYVKSNVIPFPYHHCRGGYIDIGITTTDPGGAVERLLLITSSIANYNTWNILYGPLPPPTDITNEVGFDRFEIQENVKITTQPVSGNVEYYQLKIEVVPFDSTNSFPFNTNGLDQVGANFGVSSIDYNNYKSCE